MSSILLHKLACTIFSSSVNMDAMSSGSDQLMLGNVAMERTDVAIRVAATLRTFLTKRRALIFSNGFGLDESNVKDN